MNTIYQQLINTTIPEAASVAYSDWMDQLWQAVMEGDLDTTSYYELVGRA